MATLPSAIIFVNDMLYSDGYYNTRDNLIVQLCITEAMDGAEFDARVRWDENYPAVVKNNGQRILVMRNFSDLTNRSLADVAIYVKNGLAAIEKNNIGPPNKTYPVKDLTIYHLVNFKLCK